MSFKLIEKLLGDNAYDALDGKSKADIERILESDNFEAIKKMLPALEKYIDRRAVIVGMIIAWRCLKKGENDVFNGNKYLAGMLNNLLDEREENGNLPRGKRIKRC